MKKKTYMPQSTFFSFTISALVSGLVLIFNGSDIAGRSMKMTQFKVRYHTASGSHKALNSASGSASAKRLYATKIIQGREDHVYHDAQ
jgi:hypothetical protein